MGLPSLTLALALALVGVLPAACGGTDANTQFAVQLLADDCAPNDGPAIRLVLAPDQVDCTTAGDGESVEIVLYRGDVVPPLTVTFSPVESYGTGFYCPGPGPCYDAQSGEVTFANFDRNGETVGSFRLNLQSSSVEGNFAAAWCTPPTPVACR